MGIHNAKAGESQQWEHPRVEDDSGAESTGENIPYELSDQGEYPFDESVKHAYFDYASEKSLSHAESKLVYLRHQQETSQHEQRSHSSLQRSKTLPSPTYKDPSRLMGRSDASDGIREGYDAGEGSRRLSGDACPLEFSPSERSRNQDNPDDADTVVDGVAPSRRQVAAGHFVSQISDISPELSSIARNIKKILKLRRKYINVSLQDADSNPRDDVNHWKIYPPPPNPIWDENKNRPKRDQADMTNGQDQMEPGSPVVKPRKAGTDIGQDFDIRDMTPVPGDDESTDFEMDDCSVFQLKQAGDAKHRLVNVVKVPLLRDYYKDLNKIQEISSDGPTKSFAYRQLEILEGKFHLYSLVNAYQENMDCKKVPRKSSFGSTFEPNAYLQYLPDRDFYNVRKVDTHVHHSACMNQKHLLRFIKSKMKKSPQEKVLCRDGKHLSLEEVFDSINLTAYDLSIDTLDMHVSDKIPDVKKWLNRLPRHIRTRFTVLTSSI